MRSLTAQVKWLGAGSLAAADGCRGPSGARVTRVVGWPQPFAIIAYCPGSDDDEDLYFL
jgi:hypothetical protein